MTLWRNQQGFLSVYLLVFSSVIFIVVLAAMLALAYGINTRTYATYQWTQAAMDHAVMAANWDGWSPDQAIVLNTTMAKSSFLRALAEMTKTVPNNDRLYPLPESDYPGPIELVDFQAIYPGNSIPGKGIAAVNPGYWVQLSVPVFGGSVPFVGEEYITVPMSYFAVVGAFDPEGNGDVE